MKGRENEVSRQGGLDGDLGGFEVADLADQDDVGILAQEGPQRGREGQADLVLRLHLVDPDEIEFDRVLGGHDVDFRVVQLRDGGIERVRLAGAGRSGDEHDSVGTLDRVLEPPEGLRLEAEERHVELELALVEQAHHDLLAEQRGDRRDAEVEVARAILDAKADLDPAVLREPLFGDVELRHDLQARDQRVARAHRKSHDVVKHAVDPEPHAELLFVRLHVDVRGARLERLDQDQVRDLDDRRRLGRFRERVEIDLLAFHAADDVELGPVFQPADLVEVDLAERNRRHVVGREARGHHFVETGPAAERGAETADGIRDLPAGRGSSFAPFLENERPGSTIVTVDRGPQGDLRGDDRFDVVSRHELDVVHREHVRGIAHRDRERRPGLVDGKDHVFSRDVSRHQLDDARVDLEMGEVDRGNAELVRERLGDVFLRGMAEPDEDLAELAALLPLVLQRRVELLLGDDIGLQKQIAQFQRHRYRPVLMLSAARRGVNDRAKRGRPARRLPRGGP